VDCDRQFIYSNLAKLNQNFRDTQVKNNSSVPVDSKILYLFFLV